MIVVAVNISRSLEKNPSIIDGAKRAWALSLSNCILCDFVLAVDKGVPVGFFKNLKAFPDRIDKSRVAFNLRDCTPAEIALINVKIAGINLKGIQRGKYIR